VEPHRRRRAGTIGRCCCGSRGRVRRFEPCHRSRRRVSLVLGALRETTISVPPLPFRSSRATSTWLPCHLSPERVRRMAPLGPLPKAATWSGASKGSGSNAAGSARREDCRPRRAETPPRTAAAPRRNERRPAIAPPGEARPSPGLSRFVINFDGMEVDIVTALARERCVLGVIVLGVIAPSRDRRAPHPRHVLACGAPRRTGGRSSAVARDRRRGYLPRARTPNMATSLL
jgi:hypothetical protein